MLNTELGTISEKWLGTWSLRHGERALEWVPSVLLRIQNPHQKKAILLLGYSVEMAGKRHGREALFSHDAVNKAAGLPLLIRPSESRLMLLQGPLLTIHSQPQGKSESAHIKLFYSEVDAANTTGIPQTSKGAGTSMPTMSSTNPRHADSIEFQIACSVEEAGFRDALEEYARIASVEQVLLSPPLITVLLNEAKPAGARAMKLPAYSAEDLSAISRDTLLRDIVYSLQEAVDEKEVSAARAAFLTRLKKLEVHAGERRPERYFIPPEEGERPQLVPGLHGSQIFELVGKVSVLLLGEIEEGVLGREFHIPLRNRTHDTVVIKKILVDGEHENLMEVTLPRKDSESILLRHVPPVEVSIGIEEHVDLVIFGSLGGEHFTERLRLNLAEGSNVTGNGPLQGTINPRHLRRFK